MKILFSHLIEEVVKTSRDLWSKGWAEANAGNISVRMKPENCQFAGNLKSNSQYVVTSKWIEIGSSFPTLAKEFFLITGSGMYMRNIEFCPEDNLGVIELNEDGSAYRIVWGFESGAKPTSELFAHLEAHTVRKRVSNGEDRTVIHTHCPNLVALTYLAELNSISLSRLLWEMHTECLVVFPEGIGFVPWILPGSSDLAKATAKDLETHRATVWQWHGICATGKTLDAAFGLIHTVDKAASIYLKAASSGGIKHKLGNTEFEALAKAFNVNPNPEVMAAV